MGGLSGAVFAVVLLCAFGSSSGSTYPPPEKSLTLRKRYWHPSESPTHILKIGTPLSLSHDSKYASYGTLMYNSWHMYFDWLSRTHNGVKVNGTNYSVELVLLDDDSLKANVEWATDFLIQNEGIDILMATYSSGLSRAQSTIAQANGKVMLAAGASRQYVYEGKDMVFGMFPPQSLYIDTAMNLIGAAEGGSTKTVMMLADPGMVKPCEQVPRLAAANNMTILQEIMMMPASPSEADVRAIVANLTLKQPDIVVSCTYASPCHMVLAEMTRVRYMPKALLMTLCPNANDFADIVGPVSKHIMGVSMFVPSPNNYGPIAPGWTGLSYHETYQERFGAVPSYHGCSAFTSAATLVYAIEQANSLDPRDIAATLQNTRAGSPWGEIVFDSNGQMSKDMVVMQHTGFGNNIVAPAQIATAQLVYPKPGWDVLECYNTGEGQAANTLTDGFLNGACVTCPTGRMSILGPPDSGAALHLPIRRCLDVTGKHCTTLANGTVSCAPCQAGYFCPSGTGIPCTKGKYCPVASVAPSLCVSGSVTPAEMATSSNDCQPCQPGNYSGFTGGATGDPKAECIPCDRGAFAPTNGSSSCRPCAAGTIAAQRGQDACTPCPKGFFTNEVGLTECSPCSKGEFAAVVGTSECSRCPQGEYSDQTNVTRCTVCPVEGTSTMGVGARAPEECVCRAGTYLALGSGLCIQCPEKMECPVGSSEASLRSVAAGTGPTLDSTGANVPYPSVEQAFWTSNADPLVVFRCLGPAHCPGGDPGTCAPQLSSLACAHCANGFYWNGQECAQCSSAETSALIFPVVPILLSFVVVCVIYCTSRDPLPRWGSWQNSIIALGFIALSHYQILHLINTANVPKMSVQENTWKVWAVSSDVLSVFRVDCAGMGNFSSKFIMAAASPLVLLCTTVMSYLGSQLLAKLTRKEKLAMEFNCIWNVFFSLIFAFFIGITSMSLSLFKCNQNPGANEKATNALDPSVICYEGEWNSLVVVATFSVLIYCVGCGALFSQAIWYAARGDHFSCVGMQKRWKFLFIKFRPDAPGWALAVLIRGILQNAGFVFMKEGLWQLYWVMIVEAIYLFLTAYFLPWRLRSANWCSVLASVSLLFACTLTSMYAERTSNNDDRVAMMSIVMSFGPSLVIGLLAGYVAVNGRFLQTHQDNAGEERMKNVIINLSELDEEAVAELYHRTCHWDRYYLKKFCDVVQSEFLAMDTGHFRASSKVATRDILAKCEERRQNKAAMEVTDCDEDANARVSIGIGANGPMVAAARQSQNGRKSGIHRLVV